MSTTSVAVVGDLQDSPVLTSPGRTHASGPPASSGGGGPRSRTAATVPSRDYFPQAAVAALPRYLPIVGPLTPTPDLTLAQAVEGWAA